MSVIWSSHDVLSLKVICILDHNLDPRKEMHGNAIISKFEYSTQKITFWLLDI